MEKSIDERYREELCSKCLVAHLCTKENRQCSLYDGKVKGATEQKEIDIQNAMGLLDWLLPKYGIGQVHAEEIMNEVRVAIYRESSIGTCSKEMYKVRKNK